MAVSHVKCREKCSRQRGQPIQRPRGRGALGLTEEQRKAGAVLEGGGDESGRQGSEVGGDRSHGV